MPPTYGDFDKKNDKKGRKKLGKKENSQYFFENDIGLYYGKFGVFYNEHSRKWAVLWGKWLVAFLKSAVLWGKR